MADIANVFHWRLEDMLAMDWDDLRDFHRAAVERWKINVQLANPQIKF